MNNSVFLCANYKSKSKDLRKRERYGSIKWITISIVLMVNAIITSIFPASYATFRIVFIITEKASAVQKRYASVRPRHHALQTRRVQPLSRASINTLKAYELANSLTDESIASRSIISV